MKIIIMWCEICQFINAMMVVHLVGYILALPHVKTQILSFPLLNNVVVRLITTTACELSPALKIRKF